MRGKYKRVYKPGSVPLLVTIIHLGDASLRPSSNLPENQVRAAPCPGKAGRVFLFGLALNGVYHATNGYPLRGALLPHPFTLTKKLGGLLSAALSVGSHRPAVSWHSALQCPDFPRSKTSRLSNPLTGANSIVNRCKSPSNTDIKTSNFLKQHRVAMILFQQHKSVLVHGSD